jgi:hypothetical protein
MAELSENSGLQVYRRLPDIVIEYFEDGGLLLRLSDRQMIEFNPVGCQILGWTDGQRSAAQTAVLLAEQFEIPLEEALQDTLEFYRDLETQGILEKVTVPT